MHFGRHLYSVVSSDGALTVISPVDLLMFCGWAVITIFVLGAFILMHAKPRSFSLVALLMLAILSFISSHGSIVFDGARGVVHVKIVTFFWPKHYDYPLASVMGASIASSEQSDALRLVFNGGSDLQLTPYNQMGGKGEAAYAINQYIRQHGGPGIPF